MAFGEAILDITKVFSTPHIHSRVIFSQLLKVGFVHCEKPTSYHRCSVKKENRRSYSFHSFLARRSALKGTV